MARTRTHVAAAALGAGMALMLSAAAARAELFIYSTPDGQTVYADRVLSKPGYVPRNAAARRGPARYTGPLHPVPRPGAGRAAPHPARAQVDALIDRLAPEYKLDPALVKRVVEAESGYRVRAVSSKNAQGLMQLIPDTQRRFDVTDPYDAEQNLRGGMAYLRWLLAQFRGDVRLALAGYNAGEGAVARHDGVPPYAETQAYVARITGRYGKTTHPFVAGAVAGRPAAPRVAIINGRDMLAGGRVVAPASTLAGGRVVAPARTAPGRVIAAGRGGTQPRLIAAGSGG